MPEGVPTTRPRVWAWALTLVLLLALPAASAVPPPLAAPVTQAAAPPGTGALPFALPPRAELVASGRPVFAHYVPAFPLSFDNAPAARDYYARNYLRPEGENGIHAAYGGYLRDRPLPRPVRGGDWRRADLETEVRQAVAAGLDGFTLDLPQLGSGQAWERSRLLLQAAHAVDPTFRVVLMPDLNSLQDIDVQDLAAGVAELAREPAAHRLVDGRLVVAPFLAERHPASWWATFLTLMAGAHATPVALLPVFLDERPHLSSFAPISYGFSNWGTRNPAGNRPDAKGDASPRERVARVHELGKIWMQPVSVQDSRPRSGVFQEAGGTENLRSTWQIARETQSDWVQLATWNDYAESTHLAPSVHHGWALLDVSAYYLTWFKTGAAPRITRDVVYLVHRTQRTGARPAYPQTLLMRRTHGTTSRDEVEALAFLRAPARVTVTSGDNVTTCRLRPGIGVCGAPLRPGRVTASLPGVTVQSPFVVRAVPPVQDLQYVAVGSTR